MKDMHGTPLEVGDIVGLHIWGTPKCYHPVGRIVVKKQAFGDVLVRVQLRWISDNALCNHTHDPKKDLYKIEIEDLI